MSKQEFLAWVEKLAADRAYVIPGPSASELQEQANIDAERAPMSYTDSRAAVVEFAELVRKAATK